MTFNDNDREGLERFTVSITAATSGDFAVTFADSGSDTLVRDMALRDDEAVFANVVFSMSSVEENSSVSFRIILDQTVMEEITLPWRVDFDFSSDTPLADETDFVDNVALSGTVAIAANTLTSASIPLGVLLDSLVEGDEVFRVIVPTTPRTTSDDFNISEEVFTSDPVLILDRTVSELSVSVDTRIVDEDVNRGNDIEFTVSLSDSVTAGRDLVFAVSCGGEVSEADFVNGCVGEVSILSGARSGVLTLTAANDIVVEGSEMFRLAVTPNNPASDKLRLTPTTAVSSQIAINDDDSVVISLTAEGDTVSEGNTATFRVNLSGGTVDEPIDVTWRGACIDSGAGVTEADFAGTPSPCGANMLRISEGMSSSEFTVSVRTDMLAEGEEMFAVTLTGVSPTIDGRITISDTMSTASVTIQDTDRGVISVTVGTNTVSEGDEVTFTVILSGGVRADEDIAVDWSVTCSGDVTVSDFTGTPSPCDENPLTIESGSISADFTITTDADMLLEGMETFTVTLSRLSPDVSPDIASRIAISDTMNGASVTISDRDAGAAAISLSGDAKVLEGTTATFTVTLEGGVRTAEDITLSWSATCATSVTGVASPADFADPPECPSGTVTIMADTPSANFVVTPLADMLVEGEETFIVTVSNPTVTTGGFDVSLLSASVNVRINDRDAAELLVSVNPVDLIVDEDEDGMNTAVFTLSLPDGVTAVEDIGVDWSVNCADDMDGVASRMDFANGVCPSGTVMIAAGQTSTVFSFMTFDDTDTEVTESFTVSITATTSGNFVVTFADSDSGTLMREMTLRDDEAVTLSFVINPLSVPEGEVVTFNLLLSQTVSETLTVPWRVDFDFPSDTPLADATDFVGGTAALSGIVSIAANTLASASIPLGVLLDSLVEGDEVFRVMSQLNNDITTSEGLRIPAGQYSSDIVTILDGTVSELSVSVDTQKVDEGGDIDFTVNLSDSVTAGRDLVFTWAVNFGAGVDTSDFSGVCMGGDVCGGQVSIPNDARSGVFTLTTANDRNDRVVEGSEMFSVTVTPADPASDELRLTPTTAVSSQIVINDTDSVVISITAVVETVSEREGEPITFRVDISDGRVDEDITVFWSVACDGVTLTPSDFVGGCPSGTAMIAANETSTIFTIMTDVDNLVENDEEFAVTLTGVSPTIDGRITISDTMSTASVTITDKAVLSVSGPDSVDEDPLPV